MRREGIFFPPVGRAKCMRNNEGRVGKALEEIGISVKPR